MHLSPKKKSLRFFAQHVPPRLYQCEDEDENEDEHEEEEEKEEDKDKDDDDDDDLFNKYYSFKLNYCMNEPLPSQVTLN